MAICFDEFSRYYRGKRGRKRLSANESLVTAVSERPPARTSPLDYEKESRFAYARIIERMFLTEMLVCPRMPRGLTGAKAFD